MTRRRALALVFGALAIVFVVGSIITVTGARRSLIDTIDGDLTQQLDLNRQFTNTFIDFDAVDALERIDIRDSPQATIIIDSLGQTIFEIPAGPFDGPLPPPDLPPSRIIDRVGTIFTVDGTGDGPSYRVIAGRLDDDRFVAIATPLDDVNDVVRTIERTLLLTLFGIVASLGLVFWLLLRASLRPYDELVNTAEAIADGDMDRRAVQTTPDPEIGRLTSSLNTMLDRLQASFREREAAEQTVKQFAADASHELRTPITTIAGYSEVYLSGAATDPESVHKQMTRIHSEAARMGRLVNELLTLARLDQGRGLHLERVRLSRIADDAVADATLTDQSPAVTLSVDGFESDVIGDADALHQVVVNLLNNATVHAPGASVTVAVTATPGLVELAVSDDGPGMSDEVAAHAFDRFYRAEQSRTSSVRNSGLGLSIVAAIVEGHGGTVALDTAPGHGTTLTIRLPPAPDPTA